jgi:hypothetical protein
VSSEILTLQNGIVGNIHTGTGYLDAELNPMADFKAGQVRGVGSVAPVLNLGLLIPTSVLVVFGGEFALRPPESFDGGAHQTYVHWHIFMAVKSYGPVEEGSADLFQLHDDVLYSLEGFPVGTAVPEMPLTKTFFSEFKPWTDTPASMIWRAVYATPYVRKARRAV